MEEDKTISTQFSTENISDNSFNNDQINSSTISNDFVSKLNSESTYKSETGSSLFDDNQWSLSSTKNDLYSTISTEQTNLSEEKKISDQWFNVNISNREGSNRSEIFWKKVNGKIEFVKSNLFLKCCRSIIEWFNIYLKI
jgi:hypothetical protein